MQALKPRLKTNLLLPLVIICIALIACNDTPENKPINQPADQPLNQATQTISPETFPIYPTCKDLATYEERYECSKEQLNTQLHTVMYYPQEIMDNPSLKGEVQYNVLIQEDGALSKVELIKSLNDYADAAAKNAIEALFEKSGPWIPATLNGQNVATYYPITIIY